LPNRYIGRKAHLIFMIGIKGNLRATSDADRDLAVLLSQTVDKID